MKRVVRQYNQSGGERNSEVVFGEEAEAVTFLNDFVIMKELKWHPRDIELLTEFEYEAILATIQTLNSLRKADANKPQGKGRR